MGSCVTQGGRITINLKNSESYPVQIVASCGPFSQTLILFPGQSWNGWVPYAPGWGDVKVDIRQYSIQQ
jgi:hypothetical protein